MYDLSRLFLVCAAITICASAPAWAGGAPGADGDERKVPVRLDPAALAGEDLAGVAPAPKEFLLSGESQPRRTVLFKSDSVVVVVFEESPIKLRLRAPGMPYDEFVHIVNGSLVLTDDGGKTHEFGAGDFVVIPKGFTGTWETRSNFRELVVISRKDWDATH